MNIRPYEKNAKKHPDNQLRQLAAIVKEVGWRQPVLVNREGIIVAGHGRWSTWEQHGHDYNLKEIWVIDDSGKTVMGAPETTPLTTDQENTYRLADNKLNESDWDMALVTEELKGLSLSMLDLTGFDRDLILEASVSDNSIPTDSPKRAAPGDIWQLGAHRVLCGDACQIDPVLALMDGVKVDMYLTDPPYNVNYEGKTKDKLKIDNDQMADEEFLSFLIEAFTVADTVMKAGAVFYIWHADSEGYNFRGACHQNGWKVRQCLIWNKNVMVMGRQDYHWKHEPCLYGWKEGASHLWNSDRTQTTILNFDRPTESKEHPTMKPIDLLVYQITNNTKGEDVVFDSFLGSGSTLIAAQKTGRICYGVELDPKYVDVILKRWEEYTGEKAVKLKTL